MNLPHVTANLRNILVGVATALLASIITMTPGTVSAGESFELIHGPREVGITELFRARRSAQRD